MVIQKRCFPDTEQEKCMDMTNTLPGVKHASQAEYTQ